MNQYEQIVAFIKELERLKDINRTAWTSEGRRESVAEHSWRLSMFAMILEDYFPDVNIKRVTHMCLVHDLGEAYEGDVSAKLEENREDKLKREQVALLRLVAPLKGTIREKILGLCQEYNLGETPEAKLAKALDKIETIIQHNQGRNPSDFDYAFNLHYGEKNTRYDPVIRALREIIDQETLQHIQTNHEY
jgi:putative hydrolase of HD superfamily